MHSMRQAPWILAILLAGSSCSNLQSQQQRTPKPLSLVLPTGPGRILVPTDQDIQLLSFVVSEHGTRATVDSRDKQSGLYLTYSLYPNLTGSTSPRVCLQDEMKSARAQLPGWTEQEDLSAAPHLSTLGVPIATAVYSPPNAKMEQRHIFQVSVSSPECAQMHLSTDGFRSPIESAITYRSGSFLFDPSYPPTPRDYLGWADYLDRIADDQRNAALYYQSVLETLPAVTAPAVRRHVIDRLSHAYNRSGQADKSRSLNERGIQSDPAFPMYYYNLACADAEEGKAAQARTHLEQAFAHQADRPEGERLPDPSLDDSILKLKNDKQFWSFIQLLPKN